MHSKSENIGNMISDETDEVMQEVFNSLKNIYVHLVYYKCHKINPNHGVSCANSPDWIKIKKGIINSINKKKDNKCFQYTIIVALNYEEIEKHA